MADEKTRSRDEEIGFHRGALSTLGKEREELKRILTIVEHYIQVHNNALKELGVDVSQQEDDQPKKTKKKPIEDIL